MRKENGFTLIELLIVLAILGILVGVVAMSVGGLTDSAAKRAMNAELQVVQTAIDTYNTQNVAVDGDAAIEARGTAAQIRLTDADAPFTEYLKRDTKYYYRWEAEGANLAVSETAGETP